MVGAEAGLDLVDRRQDRRVRRGRGRSPWRPPGRSGSGSRARGRPAGGRRGQRLRRGDLSSGSSVPFSPSPVPPSSGLRAPADPWPASGFGLGFGFGLSPRSVAEGPARLGSALGRCGGRRGGGSGGVLRPRALCGDRRPDDGRRDVSERRPISPGPSPPASPRGSWRNVSRSSLAACSRTSETLASSSSPSALADHDVEDLAPRDLRSAGRRGGSAGRPASGAWPSAPKSSARLLVGLPTS